MSNVVSFLLVWSENSNWHFHQHFHPGVSFSSDHLTTDLQGGNTLKPRPAFKIFCFISIHLHVQRSWNNTIKMHIWLVRSESTRVVKVIDLKFKLFEYKITEWYFFFIWVLFLSAQNFVFPPFIQNIHGFDKTQFNLKF